MCTVRVSWSGMVALFLSLTAEWQRLRLDISILGNTVTERASEWTRLPKLKAF